MYDKLTNDFKNELIDRRIDKTILIMFSILFLIYLVTTTILWSVYNYWVVLFVSNSVLAFVCATTAYTIIFMVAKKENLVYVKDYFHFRHVKNSLKHALKKDVDILSALTKSHGINTRPKVQEAIRHYHALLLKKSNNGFAIISVLSLTISVVGIIFSVVNYDSSKDLISLMVLLFSIILCVTAVCFFVKKVYRETYYSLSDYALFERIEAALSEIWVKQSK